MDEIGKYLQDLVTKLVDDVSKKILFDFCQADSVATGPSGKGRVPKSLSFDDERMRYSRDSDSISTFSESSADREGSNEDLSKDSLAQTF